MRMCRLLFIGLTGLGCLFFITSSLFGDESSANRTGVMLQVEGNIASPNVQDKTDVSRFLTPDGRFDLPAAREAGFSGSLNLAGFDFQLDPVSGDPKFRPSLSKTAEEHPDDVYWDNSLSSSIPGVDWTVLALAVYEG